MTVLCGQGKYHKHFPQSLVNPSIVVEVLSPSNEACDRGAKFDHYRRIETGWPWIISCERAGARGA